MENKDTQPDYAQKAKEEEKERVDMEWDRTRLVKDKADGIQDGIQEGKAKGKDKSRETAPTVENQDTEQQIAEVAKDQLTQLQMQTLSGKRLTIGLKMQKPNNKQSLKQKQNCN